MIRRADEWGPLRPAVVPEGYPREYERTVRLSDGRTVFIRPVVPDDAPQLADAIMTADAETLRQRFLGGTPHVTPKLLARLTTLDYAHRFALAAIDPDNGRGVAIARFEPLDEGVAEVAVAVTPTWRRVGLATALIEMLAEAALERGVHSFTATFLAENRPVAALLDHAGERGRLLIKEGFAEFAVALDRERVAEAQRHRSDR